MLQRTTSVYTMNCTKKIFADSLIKTVLKRSIGVSSEAAHKPKSYQDIPGPKPLPIIGNAWRFLPVVGEVKLETFDQWIAKLHKDYGKIVKISGIPGKMDMVLIFNPEDVETMFRQEGQWPERFNLESFKYYRTKLRSDFYENNQGIVNSNGKEWQEARTKINQILMQPKVIEKYVPKIDKVAIDFTTKLANLRDKNLEMPSDFSTELQKWALESVTLVTIDKRLGCLENNLQDDSEPQQMIKAVRTVMECLFHLDIGGLPFWKIFTTPTLKSFIKNMDNIKSILFKHIQNSMDEMHKNENTDLENLSLLQQSLKVDPNAKRAVVMALDLMMAGIDTTSNSTAFLLYHLAKNPEQQEILYKELVELMPEKMGPITVETLNKMSYLKACIKESMRLFPVVLGTARISTKEIQLSNYIIPKGVEVIGVNSEMHKLNKYFFDADKFIPERWIRGCPMFEKEKKVPYVYLPFGHGPRKCLGLRFANFEMETLVARIIRNYKLEWHHENLKHTCKMMMVPADPLKIRLIDRN